MPSDKPVALISGANRGLGFGTARELGTRGYTVLLAGRDLTKVKVSADKLRIEGIDAHPVHLDVTDPGTIASAASAVARDFGRLDVLVNNAGIMGHGRNDGHGIASVLTTPVEEIAATLDTNTFGAIRVAQAFVPLMQRTGGGRIVNVSSGMGQLSAMGGGYPGYRMSKTALNAFTVMLAAELKGANIKVNSVCPGWVRTDMGGPNAHRSLEEGVAGIVWAATLPEDGPTGGYFQDGKGMEW